MEDRIEIVPWEKMDFDKDGQIAVDDISVTYIQNPDCTEDFENGEFQKIVLSTRNNGVARFINMKTENWSVSDETDIIKLIEDFKKRAQIEDGNS